MANKKNDAGLGLVVRGGVVPGGIVRRGLNTGVSLRAVVAMQAAVSVGLVLASPAAGQTIINSNKSAPVNLGNAVNYPSGNPFTITNGTVLSTSGATPEVYGSGPSVSVTNAGTISAGNSNYAVSLSAGGYLNNSGGSISSGGDGIFIRGNLGTVLNSGSIIGSELAGVVLYGSGHVSNSSAGYIYGQLQGVQIGLLGTGVSGSYVDNSGTIVSGGAPAILIYGSNSLTNTGGTIIGRSSGGAVVEMAGDAANVSNSGFVLGGSGAIGVDFDGVDGQLNNSGQVVVGSLGVGVFLGPGGTATNTGTIYGAFGVESEGGSVLVTNGGTIAGATAGVYLTAGGTVANVNLAGTLAGTISGGVDGVEVGGGAGYVDNIGSILGGQFGVQLLGGGAVNNTGGFTFYDSQAVIFTGSIGGGVMGVYASGAPTTVYNQGYITGGTYAGVFLKAGGAVTNAQGGVISGPSFGISIENSAAYVQNTGLVTASSGTAIFLGAGGTVENLVGDVAGTIVGAGIGVDIAGGAAGSSAVINFGTIVATNDVSVGVSIQNGGYVSNVSGASIDGGTGIAFNAVGLGNGIVNSGSIGGLTGAGIVVSGDGGIAINNAGGIINGADFGIIASNSLVNILNGGSIIGDSTGILVNSGVGYVLNSGSIVGNNYAGVDLLAGTVTNLNSGSIQGSNYGVYFGNSTIVPDVVINSGFIGCGGGPAVDMESGGYVDNQAGAFIQGGFAVGINASSVGINKIVNAGVIDSFGYVGAYIANGGGAGTVINDVGGVIYGNYNAVKIVSGNYAASLTNAGTLAGNYNGVRLENSSIASVINLAGGDIVDIGMEQYGVSVRTVSSAFVSNDGYIVGYSGVAVLTFATAGVTNLSAGFINGVGYYGVGIFVGQTASVSNAGIIFGGKKGVGVDAMNLAYVANLTGGTISGGLDGVYSSDVGQVLINNAAGGLIEGSTGAGIYLESTLVGSTDSITNAGTVMGSLNGIYASGQGYVTINNIEGGLIEGVSAIGVTIQNSTFGLVANAGSILGVGAGVVLNGVSYAGLLNLDGGTVSGETFGVFFAGNHEAIVSNSGSIGGGSFGVYMYLGDDGNVTNLAGGVIDGTDVAVDGLTGVFSLDNAGSIISTFGTAVLAASDSFYLLNESDGYIDAYYYGIVSNATQNSIDNRGLISASGEYQAIDVGGTYSGILNELGGTINGGVDGILSSSDHFTLENAGLITGRYSAGVDSEGTLDAEVINDAGGTISGPNDGIEEGEGTLGVVDNAGLITGNLAVVDASNLGLVLNRSTGTLAGNEEGIFLYYGVSVQNAGLVTGTFSGISGDGSGVISNTGSIISAGIGVYTYHRSFASSLFNAGEIHGDGIAGVMMKYGGTLSNAAGGVISGGTYGFVAGSLGMGEGTLSSGVFAPATVFNSGDISGAESGISLLFGGLVSNSAGAIIAAGTYGVAVGYVGNTLANVAPVYNAGRITGGVDGVQLLNGGTVGNDAGGTIAGTSGIGVAALGVGNVTNAGVITGGVTGISLSAGGVIQNSGSVTGGNDGIDIGEGQTASITNGGAIRGTAGAGVMLQGGSLENLAAGVIRGGTDGVVASDGAFILNSGKILDAPAPTHAGVYLSGASSLSNLAGGTISGTVGVLVGGDEATIFNEGTITSVDGGDAIEVLPAADPAQITLGSGSVVQGTIDGGGTGGQITLIGSSVLNNTIANFGSGSALTVTPGANWVGAGSWTIENVNNNGTFQAGRLNVPLNLTGNFTNVGTLRVIVTPTISTQFNVSGTAQISGNVSYVFAPGTYTAGKNYNYISAAGGATGGFTTVSYSGATPSYVTKATNIKLAGTNLGSNLALGAGATLTVVGGGTVSPLGTAVFGDENQVAAGEAQAVSGRVLDEAESAGGSAGTAAACAAAEGVMSGTASARGESMGARLTGAMANAMCGAGGWLEATGSVMSIDSDDGFAGYTNNDAGFLAGVDRPVDHEGGRLGMALGYDDSWLSDKTHNKASAGTFRIGLYGAQPLGRFTVAADLMYGHADDTSSRATGLGQVGATYSANIVSGGAEVETSLNLAGLSATPVAGVKFASVQAGSFTESAAPQLSAFKVNGDSSRYVSVQPYVNLGLSKSFSTGRDVLVTPSIAFGYALEAGDRGRSVTVIAPDGTAFAGGHVNADTSGATFQAGIAAGKNNWQVYAKYSALVTGNSTAQAGEAGLQIRF